MIFLKVSHDILQKIVFKSSSVDLVSRGYLLKTLKAGYKFESFYNVDKGYYYLFSLSLSLSLSVPSL